MADGEESKKGGVSTQVIVAIIGGLVTLIGIVITQSFSTQQAFLPLTAQALVVADTATAASRQTSVMLIYTATSVQTFAALTTLPSETPTSTSTVVPSETPIVTFTLTLMPSATPTTATSQSATNVPSLTPVPPTISSTVEITQSNPPAFPPPHDYPCQGTIVNPDSAATLINVVFLQASRTSTRGTSIRVGTTVTLVRSTTDTSTEIWYLLNNLGGQRLGWIPAHYVKPSVVC